MTVMELMERTGLRSGQRAMTYIKDGLLEINERMPEQVARVTYDIEEGVRYYSLPTNFVKMISVNRAFDDDGKYIPIPRVQNIQILQDSDSSTATNDDDLIVI